MVHATSEGSFDGGDQGLLNSYFSDWAYTDIHKHLPFLYNMVATATYSYTPAYRRYVVNYIINPNIYDESFLLIAVGIPFS